MGRDQGRLILYLLENTQTPMVLPCFEGVSGGGMGVIMGA